MRKNEAITRLCALVTLVGTSEEQFELSSHDCFCQRFDDDPFFQMDEKIIEFIEGAVHDKLTFVK